MVDLLCSTLRSVYCAKYIVDARATYLTPTFVFNDVQSRKPVADSTGRRDTKREHICIVGRQIHSKPLTLKLWGLNLRSIVQKLESKPLSYGGSNGIF